MRGTKIPIHARKSNALLVDVVRPFEPMSVSNIIDIGGTTGAAMSKYGTHVSPR